MTNGGAATRTLTTGGDNTSTAFSGVIQNGAAGSTNLTKAGTGTFTLSGDNWPAPGSEDTELGVILEPEVVYGTQTLWTRVQA